MLPHSNDIRNAIIEIYDGIQVISYISDLETYELLYVNKFTKKVFGEIKGKKCYELIHGYNKPCELCPNKRLLNPSGEPGKTYIWEYQNNLNTKWYEAHVRAVKWLNDRYCHFELARDITYRKRDEKSLMQIIKNQRLLTEISYLLNNDEVFTDKINTVLKILVEKLNIDFSFILHNTQSINQPVLLHCSFCNGYDNLFNELTNITGKAKELVYFKLQNKAYITNTMPDLLHEEFEEIISLHKIQKYALVKIGLDNENYGILGMLNKSSNENWKDFEIDLFRNISNILALNYKRKINEEALIKSAEQLRVAVTTKDKFFKIIAHDLKNPFSSIMGYSELILLKLKKLQTDKTEQFVNTILTTSKTAHNLLENLLMWARSQDGSIIFNPEKCDLGLMINETITLLLPSADNKNINIVSGVKETLLANADNMMTNTIVRNLISNAIKFTFPNGTITVDANIVKNFIEISITDTGLGIKHEDFYKLFRIDQHHSTEGTKNEKGTGLGLILCKEFAEKQGGEIWVESELGIGSKFTFTVPVWKN